MRLLMDEKVFVAVPCCPLTQEITIDSKTHGRPWLKSSVVTLDVLIALLFDAIKCHVNSMVGMDRRVLHEVQQHT